MKWALFSPDKCCCTLMILALLEAYLRGWMNLSRSSLWTRASAECDAKFVTAFHVSVPCSNFKLRLNKWTEFEIIRVEYRYISPSNWNCSIGRPGNNYAVTNQDIPRGYGEASEWEKVDSWGSMGHLVPQAHSNATITSYLLIWVFYLIIDMKWIIVEEYQQLEGSL